MVLVPPRTTRIALLLLTLALPIHQDVIGMAVVILLISTTGQEAVPLTTHVCVSQTLKKQSRQGQVATVTRTPKITLDI
tara:strand:- start:49028 stop:49264 length:237 start_codon:yes stop_codon:yes gene_type:complete